MAVVVAFGLLYFMSLFFPFEEIDNEDQVMGRFLRMITLFIDPGAIEKLKESTHILGIIVAICGMMVITGMFISVLTSKN